MTFALVASSEVSGNNGGTTPGIDTTGAKLIVLSVSYYAVPGAAVSDSYGNTWTTLTVGNNGNLSVKLVYCINPVVGAGHTFTFAGTGNFLSASATAWSSTGTPIFDQEIGGNTASGTAAVVAGTVSSLTPANNNSLVIASIGWPSTTATFTAAGSWSIPQQQPYLASNYYGNAVDTLIQTTATTIGASETIATSSVSCAKVVRCAVFYEAVVGTLTITSPTDYKTFQRSGTTGSISISGTHAGATEDIEASFNGGAYVTIASASPAGAFSGTLTGQAQGQGTLTVRKKTTTTASDTVAYVGIGDVFIVGGDSISEGRGTNAQNYSHATLRAAKFRQDNLWAQGNDGIDTGTSSGSHWPLLATQIMASQSVPVAFVSCGTGSTDVAGTRNQWAKNNSGYAGLITQAANSAAGSFRGVLMHLGPNAVVDATTLSKATYNAAIDTLAANIYADVATTPKVLVGVCGEVSTGSPPDRRAALDNIRGAIIEAWGNNTNTPPGPCLIERDYSDGVHPQSDAELLVTAQRWWLAVEQAFYAGSNARGPQLSGANWNAGRDQITVVFNRVLKTGLTFGTAAWSVSDNGTPMTISSIAYDGVNASALVITTSTAATGPAGTSTVTFASGEDAKGLVVPLSADITMPSGSAIQIPAEPIYAATVNEVDVTAPTLSAPDFSGTGTSTGSASVTTNEANGTLFCVVTLSATPPTAAQVRAGQNDLGNAAAWSGSQTVSSTGSKSFSVTGLVESTTYYAHFQHRDASSNDSAVSSSDGGSTSPPVISGGAVYMKWGGVYVRVGVSA